MFEEYVAPTPADSDDYKAAENYGRLVIVKVLEHKLGIVTPNSPNGAPGVIVNVCDVLSGGVYRNVLMMTGAIVDGFKPYVGKLLVVTWDKRVATSGRPYPSPMAATPDQITQATAVMQKGDPFAEKIETIDSEPPF